MRQKGRSRSHPLVKEALAQAQIYSSFNDPNDVIRHSGGGFNSSFWDGMAQNPFAFPNVLKWDFKTAYDVNTTNVWTETATGSGTSLTVQDALGGKAKATNAAADNDYYAYASKYEIALPTAGKGLWLLSSVAIADADQADFFFGLISKGATVWQFDTRVDDIGFYVVDGSAALYCETSKSSVATQKAAGISLTDAKEMFLGIHVDGVSKVSFWAGATMDMSLLTTISDNIPDDEELTVGFGCRNGTTAANSLTISSIILINDK